MTYDYKQIIDAMPHSRINNQRSIVRRMISSALIRPSEGKMQGVEAASGIAGDWSDRDYGEEPEELKE